MAKQGYAVELKAGLNAAQFNVDGKEVEVTADSPRYETDDQALHKDLLNLPFLKDASEKQTKADG